MWRCRPMKRWTRSRLRNVWLSTAAMRSGCFRNTPDRACRSGFALDPGAHDHLFETLGLRRDELTERLRRAERHRRALRNETVARVGLAEHRVGLAAGAAPR